MAIRLRSFIVRRTDPAQIIAPGSYRLTSYSAVDGEELWFVRGLTCQPKSAPTIAGDMLYFSGWTSGNDAGQQVDLPVYAEVAAVADANKDGKFSPEELPKPWQPTGSWRAVDLDRDGLWNEREWTFFRTRRAARNGLLAIKLGGSGDVTDTHVRWRFEKSLPDVPTPLVYNGVVFLTRNGGIMTTLDAETGKMIKRGRLTGAIEDYYSSPIGVAGKVYIASERGKSCRPTGRGRLGNPGGQRLRLGHLRDARRRRRPHVYQDPGRPVCHRVVELGWIRRNPEVRERTRHSRS